MRNDGRVMDCTQADISRVLGISKVTVNQTLRALTEKGVISIGYGAVRFEDREGLSALADRA